MTTEVEETTVSQTVAKHIVEVKNCDVYYGESIVLRDISYSLKENKISAIMGRNGVGKTTTLKLIMGLLEPKKGQVLYQDRDITSMSTHMRARNGIAYVPQGREIFPKLTVYQNLKMGLEANPDRKAKIPEDYLYQLFPDIGRMKNRMGGNLSGGQQQQLAIARALTSNPKVLILDEPTEGIQPSIIQDIERVLIKLNEDKKLSIILVEQYLDFAKKVASDVTILSRGSVVMSGAMEELTDDLIKQHLTF